MLFVLIFLIFTIVKSYIPIDCEKVKFKGPKPSHLKPLVVIPGIGGSSLDCRLNGSAEPHFWCRDKTRDWYPLYINIVDIIPYLSAPCFKHNMELHYDPKTDEFLNNPGVEVRPHDYGGVDGIKYMGWLKFEECYMAPLIDYLEQAGYQVGKNLRGAPFDWRTSPIQWAKRKTYSNLKALIEETYKANNNTKVALVSHSLGCAAASYFLRTFVSKEWKLKYIDKYVSLHGPYDGSFFAANGLVSGYSMGLPLSMKYFSLTYGAFHWMSPNKLMMNRTFLHDTEKGTSYRMKDWNQLMKDLENTDTPVGWDVYSSVMHADKTIFPGDVNMHCIYGNSVKTPMTFSMKNLAATKFDILDYMPGDGLVHEPSGAVCEKWKKEGNSVVTETDTFNHLQIVQSQAGVEMVFKALYSE